ncbi:LamG-like jellyroll fold domain-containing protein [Sinosporangium siamense]|uniref:LamG-like jellyroll fold domain-containing protein n=1 Tax=Sinosporangium siamense TaxID=1367973 RepID=UPI0019518F7B|nr:LamG-like jellyroll fold domain-containing protein [Sinosporangium siamense]
MDAAKHEAKKQNKRIEIPYLRSENSTTFANPDSRTLYTEVHSNAIRVQKDGAWQAIDTMLVEQDGIVKPKAIKGELTLSGGGTTTLLEIKSSEGKATVYANGKLPKPQLSGNTALYPAAYGEGIDLVVTVTPTGYRQDILIHQRPTKKIQIRVPVDLPDGLRYGKGSSSGLALLSIKDSKKIANIAPAPVADAIAASNPDKGRIGSAAISVDGAGKRQNLLIAPDAKFLSDPHVTYPVTITAASDTWTGTGLDGDTFVSHSYPNSSSNQSLDRIIAGKSNNGSVTWRSYVRFNVASTPLMGGTVENADLRLWNHQSNTCDSEINSGIIARRITTDWDINTMTWNSQPSVTDHAFVANKGAYDMDCPRGEGELYYSIEQMVQGWMDGTADYGVQFSAVREDDITNWRWHRSSEYGYWGSGTPRGPVLFVQYIPAPQPAEVGTLQYGNWSATQEELIDQQGRQTEIEDPPFTTPSDEEARQAALNSDVRTSINANELQAPVHLTGDALQEFADDEGGGFEEYPEPPPEQDTIPPQVLTDPSDGETGVDPNVEIRVAFTESVSGPIFAIRDSVGADVTFLATPIGDDPDTPEVEPGDRGWALKPAQPLHATKPYRIEVKAASDATGNIMADYAATFTTRGQVVPVPGLVAAYGMEEGAGATVTDASGQNNTGTAVDATWDSAGKFGQALSFNGSTSVVNVADAPSLRLTTALTLSAWVKPTTLTDWRTVVAKQLSSSNGASYVLYGSNGTGPSGWFQSGGQSSQISGPEPLAVDTWSHVAVTYDGTTARLYVNGEQFAEVPLSGDLDDDGGAVQIGSNSVWGEFFSGLIDEVRIYNIAQTSGQIQTDMASPIGSTQLLSGSTPPLSHKLAPSKSHALKLIATPSEKVAGKTLVTSLAPRFKVWTTGVPRLVEMQVIEAPTKSSRSVKTLWSGKAMQSVKRSYVHLDMSKGRLRNGQSVRWRARTDTTAGWSPWQDLRIEVAEKEPKGRKVSSVSVDSIAAQADEDALVTDCWAHEHSARNLATDGYLASRHSWCAIQELAKGDARFGTSNMVNGITADTTIVGYTISNGEGQPTDLRYSRYRISLKDVTPVGGAYNQWGWIAFGVKTENSQCKVWGDTYVEGSWQEWRDGKVAAFTIASEERNGTGIDKVEWCYPKFYSKVWLPQVPSTKVKYYWSDAKPQVRCDSAYYITRNYGSGCVFDKATAVYRTTESRPGYPWTNLGDPDNVNMAYRSVPAHIWTAQHKPELTIPIRLNKSIPGHWLGGGAPLSRQNNKTWKRKNNEKSREICRTLFTDYDRRDAELGDSKYHKVYQCDEFPFQSTMQGTWVSVERVNSPDNFAYSVRPVWHKRNTEDGIQLGAFYGTQRILAEDGVRRRVKFDQFYVEAYVPGQNPHQ